MRLFLINLGGKRRRQIDAARELQKKHTIQYWTRNDTHFLMDESEFPGTVFHVYRDALQGIPAKNIDAASFEPWSAEDIAEYAETECEFITMADKWYPDWSVNRRKDLYYDMLRYWGGVLDKFRPDCIILLGVPHEMFTFVLYRIAKHRGIRTIILDNTVLDTDRYVLIDDYTVGNTTLAKARESDRLVTIDDLSPDMRDYYLRRSQSENPLPPYMQEFKKDHTLWQSVRRFIRVSIAFVKDGTIVERGVLKLLKMFKSSLKDEHHSNERLADFGKPYVYFPLQYQPELTTSPLGGVYVDQLLAIKTVAAALPEGWELYVKEHPAQIGVHGGNTTPARYTGFYKSIAEIPHTRLVPVATNTFKLMDNAQTTSALTGTAAWESVLRGKPAVVFGYPWFMNAPGIIRVGSAEDCRKTYEKIAHGFKPQEADTLRYLQAVDEVSVKEHLYTNAPDREGEGLAMYRAIEGALNIKPNK
ncbi:MAG: hypothetical protein Q7S01_05460 [bacterium]|nr:hypothetical protein [bacterium]